MKRICLLLILLLSAALLLFSGCGDRDAPGAPMTHPVSFYYRTAVTDFAAEDGVIRAELRDLNPGLSLKELFEIYFQGPEREDLTAPFAKDCSLNDVYRTYDTRSYLHQRGISILYTFAFILMVVLLASMAVFQRLANRRSYGGA